MHTLMYAFLDEWLFNFSAEPNFIPRSVKVLEMNMTGETWSIK